MMTYLLKANLIWALLFGLYLLLLRRDTHFRWKRFTLLSIYAAGWLLPLTEPGLWHDGNEAVAELCINLGLIDIQGVPTPSTEKSIWTSIAWSELLLWGGYLGGMALLLVRFLVQLIAICRLRLRSTAVYINKMKLYEPEKPQPPFPNR